MMTATGDEKRGKPIFDAILLPHRSLGRRGFLVVMGVAALFWLGIGAYFWSIGAWPVMGFFGLDLLLLYGAFRLNYRAGRQRELVRVWRDDIEIRKIAPSGRCDDHNFNPFGTRFRIHRQPEIGITAMALSDRRQHVPIGGFLNYDERESFSKAFGEALVTAKHG